MKQIVRDRNILKRLVESYGKKDVLNYVKHLNEGLYDRERIEGSVSSDADPNGYLDGIVDIEGCERCGTDLFIAFYKGNNRNYYKSLDNIVYVEKNDDEHYDSNESYENDPNLVCYYGSVVDYTNWGGEKVLQIYLS